MRKIDADQLKALMMADNLTMLLFGKRYGLSDAMKSVDRSPTIEEPEQKKGKWINKWSGDGSVWIEQKCSECGVVFEDEPKNYNFCPNCGAKMEE